MTNICMYIYIHYTSHYIQYIASPQKMHCLPGYRGETCGVYPQGLGRICLKKWSLSMGETLV